MIAQSALTASRAVRLSISRDPKAKRFAGAISTGLTGVLHKNRDGLWTSTLGWTGRPEGHTVSFFHFASGDIEFDGKKARRIPFDVTETVFEGRGGAKLAGRLVLPEEGSSSHRSSSSRRGEGFRTRVVCAPTTVAGREYWCLRL